MKKINLTSRQEIKSDQVNKIQDYTEDILKYISRDALNIQNGVINGLTFSVVSGSTGSISSGALFYDGKICELASANNLVFTLPVSGTRIDTVSATYIEQSETILSGRVMTDVTNRIDQIQSFDSEKVDRITLTIHQNTLPTAIPAGKFALVAVTLSTTGITYIDESCKTFINQTDSISTGTISSTNFNVKNLISNSINLNSFDVLDENLNFSEDIGSPASLTRSSEASYMTTMGEFTTAASGIPRFGLPGPIARRNLITDSVNPCSSYWQNRLITSASGNQAPDGSLTAVLMLETNTTGIHETYQSLGAFLAGGYSGNSIYVKPNGRTKVKLSSFSVGTSAIFTLTGTGSISSIASGITAAITLVDFGYYRISISSATVTTTNYLELMLLDTDGNSSYAGDVAKGVYIWGPQGEKSANITPYQATNATGVDSIEYAKNPGLVLEGAASQYLTNPDTPATQTVSLAAGTYTLSMDGAGGVSCLFPSIVTGDSSTFTGGIGAWYLDYPANATFVSSGGTGLLTVVVESNPRPMLDLTTEIGKTYRVVYDIVSVDGPNGVGMGCEGSSLRSQAAGTGKTFDFTATAITSVLWAIPENGNVGNTFAIDNISVREVASSTGSTPATFTLAAPASVDFTVIGTVSKFNLTNLPFRSSHISGASRAADICATPSGTVDLTWAQNGYIEFDCIPPTISTGKNYPMFGKIGVGTQTKKDLVFWRYGDDPVYSFASYFERGTNSSTGIGGVAGRTVLMATINIWNGVKHKIKLEWFNYILNNIRYMYNKIYIDNVLIASQDVSALYSATAWTIPDSICLSDGDVFATLSNVIVGTPQLPIGATLG